METIFKNNYEKFFPLFKEIEAEARSLWKEVSPETYVEDAKVVSIEEDGITFEWSGYNWGEYSEKYFIPVEWFDRDK